MKLQPEAFIRLIHKVLTQGSPCDGGCGFMSESNRDEGRGSSAILAYIGPPSTSAFFAMP